MQWLRICANLCSALHHNFLALSTISSSLSKPKGVFTYHMRLVFFCWLHLHLHPFTVPCVSLVLCVWLRTTGTVPYGTRRRRKGLGTRTEVGVLRIPERLLYLSPYNLYECPSAILGLSCRELVKILNSNNWNHQIEVGTLITAQFLYPSLLSRISSMRIANPPWWLRSDKVCENLVGIQASFQGKWA